MKKIFMSLMVGLMMFSLSTNDTFARENHCRRAHRMTECVNQRVFKQQHHQNFVDENNDGICDYYDCRHSQRFTNVKRMVHATINKQENIMEDTIRKEEQ